MPTHEAFNPNTGMIWSGFRPSDDPVMYRFNIPDEAFAVVAMRLLSQFARVAFDDPQLAESATKLAGEVQVGDRALRQSVEPAARRVDVRLRNRRQRQQ